MQVDQLEAELRQQMEALRDRVRKHCYCMLKNADSADDATQEAMVSAWEGRSAYRRDSPLENWIMRIASNACLDQMRRQNRRPTVPFDDSKSSAPAEKDPAISQVENQAFLEQLLPSLRKCMGEQNFWIWQQRLAGVTEEQIARSLPLEWELTKHGVHSRFQRQIKGCLDRARLQHDKL